MTSSIRKTRREYDKSFHAACVSVTLARFYRAIGDNDRKVEAFLDPLTQTVNELNEVDARLLDRGTPIITEHARAIQHDLTKFVLTRDFSIL